MPTYKVILDDHIGVKLRRTINDEVDFSIRHERTRANKRDQRVYPAWNRICALMDRIQDTAEHINNIELHNEKENRSAFSFLDLMNYGSVLKDCIYEIARIYDIDMGPYKQSSSIFHMTGSDGEGSDKEYFEYLRSLCSIHPFDTGNHKRYQENNFECCPYVAWKEEHLRTDEFNYLIAQVYTNKEGEDHYKTIIISLSKVIQYIENTYQLLETIVIPGIETFKEHRRKEFRSQIIKKPEDFPDYISYLLYLKEEAQRRYSDDNDYYIDNVLRFFSVQFKNAKNQKCLVKFQNALKFAITFYHASLQNMSYEGYHNTGIWFPSAEGGTSLLYCLLFMQNNSKEAMRHGYEIGTLHELYSDTDPGYYAMSQLEMIKPFLGRYVSFDEAKTRIEYYILSQLALYADSLRHKNILNQNIPNELQYRFRRLGDKGWNKLHQERKRTDNDKVTLEEYIKLCNTYLGIDEEENEDNICIRE